MRERLDCAVLLTQCTVEWVEPLLGQHAGGRLVLHGLQPLIDITKQDAYQALGGLDMVLRRYDACLLPVWPATLSWARISLSHAIGQLHTPVLAMTRELTAAGLFDLYDLGVADFLRYPLCPHEVRVRIERLLDGRRPYGDTQPGLHHVADSAARVGAYANSLALAGQASPAVNAAIPDLEGYAIAAASRCPKGSGSFQDAKKNVIDRFERAYIHASLGRHGGNIAMAARSAKKHRRAFWALMRKHSIDAGPYRQQATLHTTHVLAGCASHKRTDVEPGQILQGRPKTAVPSMSKPPSGGKGKIG